MRKYVLVYILPLSLLYILSIFKAPSCIIIPLDLSLFSK